MLLAPIYDRNVSSVGLENHGTVLVGPVHLNLQFFETCKDLSGRMTELVELADRDDTKPGCHFLQKRKWAACATSMVTDFQDVGIEECSKVAQQLPFAALLNVSREQEARFAINQFDDDGAIIQVPSSPSIRRMCGLDPRMENVQPDLLIAAKRVSCLHSLQGDVLRPEQLHESPARLDRTHA